MYFKNHYNHTFLLYRCQDRRLHLVLQPDFIVEHAQFDSGKPYEVLEPFYLGVGKL